MHKSFTVIFVETSAILLLSVGLCFAGPPDAGQLLREQKPRQQLPQQLPTPEEQTGQQTEKVGARVLVKGFTFSGYEGLATEEELQRLVVDAIGREHGFADLKAVAARVTRYLKKQGWMLARAYLPQQDISLGIVTIAIAQGKSDGGLNIENDGTLRISEYFLSLMAEHGIEKNQPIHSRKFERAVLLMNDLPGITAKASLAPGSNPDTVALTIKASEDRMASGALWADNYGNRYTGAIRGNLLFEANDPMQIGDQLSIRLTGAEGLMAGEAGYAFPLGANGLRGHVSYTILHYNICEGYHAVDVDGDAQTVDVGISYPWLRSRTTNIYSSLGYEYKALEDRALNVGFSSRDVHNGIFSLYGDRLDNFFGGGVTSLKTAVTIGNMEEDIADIAITETEGGYAYFNVGLSRLQRLARDLTLNLSWRAQFSLDNLGSSEQFALGGPYGIRAYPVSEGTGDDGHLLSAETSYTLPIPERFGNLQWNLFYDAGYITLHKEPWPNSITTKTGENRYWLQGAGTGFEYGYSDALILRACWAFTIGDNDGRGGSGDDADGRQDDNRFWVQGVWRF